MSKRRSGVDTSKRAHAEQAQRRMDELFRALIENASDMITILDGEGIIRYQSPSVGRVLGYKPHELIGSDIVSLLHPDDLAKSLEAFRALKAELRSGPPAIGPVIEERLRHKAGSWRILEGIAKVLDTRSVKGIVINFRDITERRQAQEALRELSGRLLRLQDEEQRRIARQLHETAAQGLAGLAVNLAIVKASAADLSPRARACLSESLELAEQCSRDIRTLSYLLHPPLVDEAGLAPALRWYTSGFARRSGIEVDLNVSPRLGRLPSDLELALYHIVQEALTNIHRHSESKTARICLRRRPKELVLTVADEGHGFPPAALKMAGPESPLLGVGIPGMRERMKQLGGQLCIQSSSRGTVLKAHVPLGEVVHGETTHLTRGRS